MSAETHAGGLSRGESLPAYASLDALREAIGDCSRCSLGLSRSNLVFGTGDPHARLMFIGEAPGQNEDLQGVPFVGVAGKLLDELLASIGLAREDVYIANVLKCRPPGNRDPLPAEIETCTPYLAEQVRLVDPKVIVTLGNFATRYVLGTDRGITTLRGRLFHVDGRMVVPIFHPAAALHDQSKRGVLFDDFKRLAHVLDTDGGDPAASSDGGSDPDAFSDGGSDPVDSSDSGSGSGSGDADQPQLF